MKNDRGITLLALIITVIIMIILVAAGVQYGGTSLSEVELQNFSYELQQIQGRVNIIYEKMSMENHPNYINFEGLPIGQDIRQSTEAIEVLKELTGIDYATADRKDENLFCQELSKTSYYRYFDKDYIKEQLDIKNSKQDIIVNFKTREVISVKGQTYNNKTYYRLQDIQN